MSHNWKPITDKQIGQKLIVSNSGDATDANGDMSHIWIGRVQRTDDVEGPYICFDEADRLIWNIRWWQPLPAPVTSEEDKAIRAAHRDLLAKAGGEQ